MSMKKEKNYLIIQYQLNANESENLNISSSNIVADKVDIKAKNVVIVFWSSKIVTVTSN